jgi:predicted hotdog family 3-hydroxylacyl-ACP dehydratase
MISGGGEGFRLLGFAAPPGSAAGRPESGGRDGARSEIAIPTAARRISNVIAEADFEIPAGSVLFDGHFPGRPILPGVAHLALVRRVLMELATHRIAIAAAGTPGMVEAADSAAAAGGGEAAGAPGHTEIVGVDNLRLRLPVNPGDRLALRLVANGGASLHFDLRRGADLVSQGDICIAAPCAAGSPSAPAPRLGGATPSASTPADGARTGPEGGFPPTAALLPHAPPARLLSAVLSTSAMGIVCSAVVPTGHPLAEGASAPGFLALEIAAQAAACLEALRRQGHGPPAIGYLVGVRHADLAPTLPCGADLRISADLAGNASALAVYDFELHLATENTAASRSAGEPLAAGVLSTFLPTTV